MQVMVAGRGGLRPPAQGIYASRSDAVRAGLRAIVERHRRASVAAEIVEAYTARPQTDEEYGWGDDATRRPVLVVTRSEAVPVLRWIIVAPVTRTVRGIPTEIPLGPAQGLGDPSAATFDNLQPIRRSFLTGRIGVLAQPRTAICEALRALADC